METQRLLQGYSFKLQWDFDDAEVDIKENW